MKRLTTIARIRAERDLSQEALARLAGISVYTVSRVENGQNPGPRVLGKLARALEMSVDDLNDAFQRESA